MVDPWASELNQYIYTVCIINFTVTCTSVFLHLLTNLGVRFLTRDLVLIFNNCIWQGTTTKYNYVLHVNHNKYICTGFYSCKVALYMLWYMYMYMWMTMRMMMGLICVAAILAIDNRFCTPSLELKCLGKSFCGKKQKLSIPRGSTWPPCD